MRAVTGLRAVPFWRSVVAAALVSVAACSSEPPPPPPAPPAPAPATPEARVQWYQACWNHFNNKKFDDFQNCYTENATSDSVDATPASATGRPAIMEREKSEAAAFPDRHGEVRLILGNGDRLASIALYTATNTGEMPGPDGKPMKPTGKPIGFLIGHVVDLDAAGRQASHDAAYVEQNTMMSQLGLSPAPARKAEKATGVATEVVVAKNDDKEKMNVDAARKGIDAFNRHDLKAIDAETPANYKLIEIAHAKDMDRAGALADLKELFAAFPDVALSTPTIWAAGDYVVVEGTLSGTNTGDMKAMGLKKTGKKVTVRFLEIVKMHDGKPVEDYLFYNGAAFAAQLGLK